jgi:hypothetical protein
LGIASRALKARFRIELWRRVWIGQGEDGFGRPLRDDLDPAAKRVAEQRDHVGHDATEIEPLRAERLPAPEGKKLCVRSEPRSADP